MNDAQFRFRQSLAGQPQRPVARLLGFIFAVLAATLAFIFSLAALAVVAVGGALLGGWLWWKTRAVRRKMREQRPTGGYIIDGEVVRETDERRGERLLN